MKQGVEPFTSEPIYEFVEHCRRLVGQPTLEKIAQDFASLKCQLTNLNDLEENGKLKPCVAEERRLAIRQSAQLSVYNQVANHRITRDKLARVSAVYRRAQFGYKTEMPHVDEERTRRETLRELNELWVEIITRHSFNNNP